MAGSKAIQNLVQSVAAFLPGQSSSNEKIYAMAVALAEVRAEEQVLDKLEVLKGQLEELGGIVLEDIADELGNIISAAKGGE